MLKQIIIGGIVGGITLFFWGFISWAVMDWHFYTVQHDEGTRAVVANIETQLPETGVYYFPHSLMTNTMRQGWQSTQKNLKVDRTV